MKSLFEKYWNGRIERESRTVSTMIKLYCRSKHKSSAIEPCSECHELMEFASLRLSRCPFGINKPKCSECSVLCYRGNLVMRSRIKEVMGYAGPRMMLHHPILAVQYQFDVFWARRLKETEGHLKDKLI